MENQYILKMKGITKEFPGVCALDDVHLELRKGEVHALIGENGAGKSTLMKILFGIYSKDAGKIWLRGQEVQIANPHHAQKLGIGMVHQELNLVPQMTAAQNIALGHEKSLGRSGILNWPGIIRQAEENLAKMGLDVDLKVPVRKLSIAKRQLVEVAKALSWNTDILVMDEPTSSLTETEVASLFQVIRSLKANGVSIIFITHHMEEIFQIADRVTVLRDGKNVDTCCIRDLDTGTLIQMMVGRVVNDLYPKETTPRGAEALRVEGLNRRDVLFDINFSAFQGEILGFAGLMGAGRTELARAIFGADPIDSGQIWVNGQAVRVRSPRDAIQQGICLLTEDRKGQGLILMMPVKYNIVLAALDKLNRGQILESSKIDSAASRYVSELNIKTPNLDRAVKFLSGGNQQKAILAKWLCKGASIFIFDEPTRGIDVVAKSEVHRLMSHLAKEGACIIMISSELPEVLGMSDRILVMREGRLVGELARSEATQEKIMAYATGGKTDDHTSA